MGRQQHERERDGHHDRAQKRTSHGRPRPDPARGPDLQAGGSCQVIDEPGRGGLPPVGVDREPSPETRLDRCNLAGWQPFPVRQSPVRCAAREKCECGGGKPVDVGRGRRHAGCCQLRCNEPRRARVPGDAVRIRAGEAEVHQHDASVFPLDDVAWLDVLVDDRRIVSVQVVERLGHRPQVRASPPWTRR